MKYTIYNVGFVNSLGKEDETQFDIEEGNDELELLNLILSLKDEMDIKKVIYIQLVDKEIRNDD